MGGNSRVKRSLVFFFSFICFYANANTVLNPIDTVFESYTKRPVVSINPIAKTGVVAANDAFYTKPLSMSKLRRFLNACTGVKGKLLCAGAVIITDLFIEEGIELLMGQTDGVVYKAPSYNGTCSANLHPYQVDDNGKVTTVMVRDGLPCLIASGSRLIYYSNVLESSLSSWYSSYTENNGWYAVGTTNPIKGKYYAHYSSLSKEEFEQTLKQELTDEELLNVLSRNPEVFKINDEYYADIFDETDGDNTSKSESEYIINFGDFEEPELEQPPENFLDFFNDVFPFLRNFQLDEKTVDCPIYYIDAFGKTYTIETHCPLLEQNRALIEMIMLIVWAFISLRIVLKA